MWLCASVCEHTRGGQRSMTCLPRLNFLFNIVIAWLCVSALLPPLCGFQVSNSGCEATLNKPSGCPAAFLFKTGSLSEPGVH